MNNLDMLIRHIEKVKATKEVTTTEEINDILVSLGGEPICITDDVKIMEGKGSLTTEILLYMTLLIVRQSHRGS